MFAAVDQLDSDLLQLFPQQVVLVNLQDEDMDFDYDDLVDSYYKGEIPE